MLSALFNNVRGQLPEALGHPGQVASYVFHRAQRDRCLAMALQDPAGHLTTTNAVNAQQATETAIEKSPKPDDTCEVCGIFPCQHCQRCYIPIRLGCRANGRGCICNLPPEFKNLSRARCASIACRALVTHMCEGCRGWFCEGCTIVEPVESRRRLCPVCFERDNPIAQDPSNADNATDRKQDILRRTR